MKHLLLALSLLAVLKSARAQAVASSTLQADTLEERMPAFISDCPEGKAGKACADRAMLEYVYSRIKYPPKAHRRGVEGMAVVTFVIERDGTVSNVRILRDPGAGIGREVQRIVESMNDQGPTWHPGIQGGKHVRVQFNLPVHFRLETSE